MPGMQSEDESALAFGLDINPLDETKESETRPLLQLVTDSLAEMTGGCEVCTNAQQRNAWEGLYCVVHQKEVKRGDQRCESFERRETHPDPGEASRALAREYARKTFGINGRTLRRLYGAA
jgi:hypothetical protein